MIRLNINGYEVCGYEGQTILTVAKANGIGIPTLCHDERVTPQGACGLCVVEVEGVPRLLRACSTQITPGMVIDTQSPRVRATRQSALELLLSDHAGDCRPPCMLACPAHTDCQGYISLIANGQQQEAVKLMKEAHPLPASIGRVCPHPCEKECRRQLAEEPINIAALKYFAADLDLNGADPYVPDVQPDTGHTAVIVGGGPAGLTAAYFLKRAGHHVVVYDRMKQMGGLLRYGIPQYRLPKQVLDAELDILSRMGIVFCNEVALGRDITLSFLRDKYDAVVIATGAGISKKLNCPGEEQPGVLGGIDFLREVSLKKPVTLGRRVVVVGGSNTAMDAARTAVRLGVPEVYVVYRRSREEMPAEPAEIKEAEEEGVRFKFLVNPIEIIGADGKSSDWLQKNIDGIQSDNTVEAIRLQKMMLGAPDAGGRRSPVPVEGAEEILQADTVIAAIGQDVDITGLEALPLTKRRAVYADENTFYTGTPGVFAIGDVTGHCAYAIEAIGQARQAAAAVHAYLTEGKTPSAADVSDLPAVLVKDSKTKEDFAGESVRPRETAAQREGAENGFLEVSLGLTAEQATREAKRCLSCGCSDYYECRLLRYANEYHAKPHAYTGLSDHKSSEVTANLQQKPEESPCEPSYRFPYFSHNPDKCILCGLCVRVCDEVMGRTALGFVGRGFETTVASSAHLPNEGCTACGQCVALCPTGALREKMPLQKALTVHEKVTDTVCMFCSVGCRTQTHSKGSLTLRILPDTKQDPQALLCVKGRFGFGMLQAAQQQGKRLTEPLTRLNGSLTKTSWAEALETVQARVNAVVSQYGPEAVGIAISDRYSLEDMYAVKAYATQVIGTPHVFSFNGMRSGLGEVTGLDASTSRFEELHSAEVIVLAARDIVNTHTIAGLHIKKAVENGAKLIILGDAQGQANEWAALHITSDNNLTVLKQFTKAVMNLRPTPVQADGYHELQKYLLDITPSAEIQKAAQWYVQAKHAMVVFDAFALTVSAAHLLADAAVLAGQIGRPRAGIIQLKPNNNSQGLSELGLSGDPEPYLAMIRRKKIRALLMFGEDVPAVDLSPLDFLMVQTVNRPIGYEKIITEANQAINQIEATEKADVVLPAAAYAECEGHFTDTVRLTKKSHASETDSPMWPVWRIVGALSGGRLPYDSAQAIYKRISLAYPVLTPDAPAPYPRGAFATPDGRAKLQIPLQEQLYSEREIV